MRSRTHWFTHAVNAVIALCVLAVTGLVLKQNFFPSDAEAAAAKQGQRKVIDDWKPYAAVGHRWGPAAAPVTIVVFSDYQCPACRSLAENLKSIRAEFPQVAVVNRHYPLTSHPFAFSAAQAAECAARQGSFEPMHYALFADQHLIGVDSWAKIAQEARVADIPAFEACMAQTAQIATVVRDTVAAHGLEVTATPTFLVNEERFVGSPPLSTLRKLVQEAVEKAGRS